MEDDTPNPWDFCAKPLVRNSSRAVRSQESYRQKLKRNLSSVETVELQCRVPKSQIRQALKNFDIPIVPHHRNNNKENDPALISPINRLYPSPHGSSELLLRHTDSAVPSSHVCNSVSNIASHSLPASIKNPCSRRGSFLGRSFSNADSCDDRTSNYNAHTPDCSQLEPDHSFPKPISSFSVTPNNSLENHLASSSILTTHQIQNASKEFTQSLSLKLTPKTNRNISLSNANYLKLNLRKKCYSRKGSMRQRMLQRKVKFAKYRRKFGQSKDHENDTCFLCGHTGHWANKCLLKISQTKVTENADAPRSVVTSTNWRFLDVKQLDSSYQSARYDDMSRAANCVVKVLPTDRSSIDHLKEIVKEKLNNLGFESFKPGQEQVILRILSNTSTLAILPTAAGKSLCYQIPACIYQELCGSTALVVSPLISLMQDQVIKKFEAFEGAFLNSSQSTQLKEEILQDARRGRYAFLLVAPEALVESDWLLHPGRLPPISFACIDEAHCLADWSHHFRPAYLRVCRLLRDNLGVKCFLGLSATCTVDTIQNVCHNLDIEPTNRYTNTMDSSDLTASGYVQPFSAPIPPQLCITASMDREREEALLNLLTRPPFNELKGGILIYCATRDLTERLASFIRTRLQDVTDQIGRRRVHWTTASYHAGQTAAERSRVQKRFMAGRVRVLVATSAFGMGLNKPDLQAVIHYSLTKSFENYIQEIGRVGRAQQISYCHAFLPPALIHDPIEANELRRHIFANHIDRVLLKRFLLVLFGPVRCTCRTMACEGHVRAIDPATISEELDIKVESLATLVAYLEMDPTGPLISTLQPGYATATIDCYGGPGELAHASQRCLAVAAALSLAATEDSRAKIENSRQLCIDLPSMCDRWGWRPSNVRQELKSLEWDSSGSSVTRTGINVTMSKWSWWLWIHGPELPVCADRLDRCLDYLAKRLESVESTSLNSLDHLTQVLATVSRDRLEQVYPLESENANAERLERSTRAHKLIEGYFMNTLDELNVAAASERFKWPSTIPEALITAVRRTIREFISIHGPTHGDHLTGRNLANILHGIPTPQFPSSVWSKTRRFWRAHLNVDWPLIKKLATEELLCLL